MSQVQPYTRWQHFLIAIGLMKDQSLEHANGQRWPVVKDGVLQRQILQNLSSEFADFQKRLTQEHPGLGAELRITDKLGLVGIAVDEKKQAHKPGRPVRTQKKQSSTTSLKEQGAKEKAAKEEA